MMNVLSRRALAWLLVAQAAAVLPLFLTVPKWLPLLWLMMVLWRVQIFRGRWNFPSRGFKYLLSLICVAGLFISYSNPFALQPAVAFLTIAFVLKLGELHARRDGIIIVNIGFVALAANFLFMQSGLTSLFSLCAIAVHLSAWSCFYRLRYIPWLQQLRHASIMVLQALPIMLFLFLFMPRLGTFWHVPLPEGSGKTGFSDTMEPGDIANLIRSDDVSFRVTFTDAHGDVINQMPLSSNLYWRGIVLDYFDGRKWIRTPDRFVDDARRIYNHKAKAVLPNSLLEGSDSYYEVILEPHNQRWLFGLAAPVSVESNTNELTITNSLLLLSQREVTSRMQYAVKSHLFGSVFPAELPYIERIKYLQLPKSGNAQASLLASQWWRDVDEDIDAYIDNVFAYYQASFVYTLQPPRLGKDSVDDFLFQSQRGFCEHFASSFVFLMRSVGIPARIVLGYQGGEINPQDDYLIVKQSDAHAWAEVWRENLGWQRVDPTGAVAPSRIEQGLTESLPEEDQRVRDGLFGMSGHNVAWLNNVRLKMDGMSYAWHRWVLGYDEDERSALVKRWFGSNEPWMVALVLLLGGACIILSYFILTSFSRRKTYTHLASKYYARHLTKLAKLGFVKAPNETPTCFARRVARQKPNWRKGLFHIAVLHDTIIYAGNEKKINALARAVRHFPR